MCEQNNSLMNTACGVQGQCLGHATAVSCIVLLVSQYAWQLLTLLNNSHRNLQTDVPFCDADLPATTAVFCH